MAKMDCETQRKRRRIESQTSNVSAQTQMTDLSQDSSIFSDANSTSAQTNALRQEQRRRTVSERRFSAYGNEDGTRISFETGDSPPMGGRIPRRERRNTENSVNTQIKPAFFLQQNTKAVHKCKTTSCIQDSCAQQERLLPNPTQPFQYVSNTERKMPVQYDNNHPSCYPRSLQASNRSGSERNVENTYISLDNQPDFYIRPINTVVTKQQHGVNTALLPNGHALEEGTDALSNNPSSGYVRADFKSTGFCCCIRDSSQELKFYKKGLTFMFVINVIVILTCLVGLPIAHHLSHSEPPEDHPPLNCFDSKEAAELVGEQQALVQEQPSGKYCPNYKRMIQKIGQATRRNDTCRPALELDGVWNKQDGTLAWKFKRKSCGLILSADKTTILINETGDYFIFSRILFGTQGLVTDQQEFPMGHSLIKNGEPFEKINQHCRVNQSTVQHTSSLHTIEYLSSGDRIKVKVIRDSQIFMDDKSHKFGLFKL